MLPISEEIRFEVINICQYNCKICMKNELKRQQQVMTLNTFKMLLDKILSETKQYKAVSFAGIGEPLLNRQIVDMVAYANKLKLKTLIVTNGDLLTKDKFLELQKAGLYSVRVSFHGATPKDYSELHGVDLIKFFQVKSQLENISKLENRKTKLLLTCVVMRGVNDNTTVNNWLKVWEDCDADSFEVWSAHNWVNSLKNRVKQKERVNSCGRILKGPLQIQVDGTVNACCFDWNGDLVFGDLKEQTLDEIFNGYRYRMIKQCHVTGEYDNFNLVCKNCDQRNKNKTESLLYSSNFKDLKERIKMTSTNYDKFK